uniref:S-protein homolog n=1 Tax=Cajanus cajan TaxID=3821 RepID=A0A151TBL9_CAJCA|nr:hypothetical protein KK1_019035 [Cajanus cajan]
MSLFSKNVLLFLTFMLLSASNVLGKVHVSVTNDLHGKAELALHCKSKNDDLGVQLLKYGETFSWKFNKNFFGGTQFYCSFLWIKNAPLLWFDIYVQTRDDTECGDQCVWFVTESGPCRFIGQTVNYTCYRWNGN